MTSHYLLTINCALTVILPLTANLATRIKVSGTRGMSDKRNQNVKIFFFMTIES